MRIARTRKGQPMTASRNRVDVETLANTVVTRETAREYLISLMGVEEKHWPNNTQQILDALVTNGTINEPQSSEYGANALYPISAVFYAFGMLTVDLTEKVNALLQQSLPAPETGPGTDPTLWAN